MTNNVYYDGLREFVQLRKDIRMVIFDEHERHLDLIQIYKGPRSGGRRGWHYLCTLQELGFDRDDPPSLIVNQMWHRRREQTIKQLTEETKEND